MRFLFVGGSQRSGTTLLQKFLCLDPAASPKLAEASYLKVLVQAYKEGRDNFDHETREYFTSREDFANFNSGIVCSFLNRTIAQYPSAVSLILKEPHLTMLFPELAELVVESRFIVTMRDPRDIMASMIGVGERMKASGEKHFFQQRNIEKLSHYIKLFYAPALNSQDQSFKGRCLTIRYEDLIQHTADVKKKLAAFSGLKLNFNSTDELNTESETEYLPRYKPWITENNNSDINDSSIGRFREVLRAEEIAQANHHCEDIIDLFQYSTS